MVRGDLPSKPRSPTNAAAVVIGPGLGLDQTRRRQVNGVLAARRATVLDAALTLIARTGAQAIQGDSRTLRPRPPWRRVRAALPAIAAAPAAHGNWRPRAKPPGRQEPSSSSRDRTPSSPRRTAAPSSTIAVAARPRHRRNRRRARRPHRRTAGPGAGPFEAACAGVALRRRRGASGRASSPTTCRPPSPPFFPPFQVRPEPT